MTSGAAPPLTQSVNTTAGIGRCPPRDVRISFIVLARNSESCIAACVRSLARASAANGVADEIWVVDNGSSDGTPAILAGLKSEYDQLNVVSLPRNHGTTVSRNMALRRAAGRYIAIVDSDVTLPPGTVDPLIAVLERDPRCGIVAPRLQYPDGRPQLSTDQFPTVQRKLQRAAFLRRMERLMPRPDANCQAVDYAISAFWLMRRELLDIVGLFDERIFYSPEDVDYCLRVWTHGFTVTFHPATYAIHHAQEISRTLVPRRAAMHHICGLGYLFWKHRYLFRRPTWSTRIAEDMRARCAD